MAFDDGAARRADAILAATIPIFKTTGEVETHLDDGTPLTLIKVPKVVAAAVQVLRERAAGPETTPCAKCGSTAAKLTVYRVAYYDWRPAPECGGWVPPEPLPRPELLCERGVCPDAEHLHVVCACGYRLTVPVAGCTLGPPHHPTTVGPVVYHRRSAWSWLPWGGPR